MIVRAGVLALFISFGAESAYCADPALEVIPAEVTTRTLPKDTPIAVEVRLKAGDAELSGISLSTFSNDGIVAELARETPAQLAKLPPKSEHSWRLKLTRSIGSVLTDAILHIRAEFDVVQKPLEAPGPAGAGGAAVPGNATPTNMTATAPESIHQLIYGIAKIKPLTAITGIELARAEIKGLPESLAHERPGQMFVVVTNQYSSPLTVKDVKSLGPSYIELLAPDAKDTPPGQQSRKPSLRIAPGQTEAIAYSIKPKSEVVPGKYTLIAAVDVESDDKLAATVMTSAQDINVVVLGESDLLKFLGIPSLLFLPGVLMLITWRFLALRGKSDEAAKKYKPQWNTSEFWVIAVALSLITALIYPWLTVLVLTNSRNFLVAYGLLDYELILGFSLVTSMLAFGVARGARMAWNARKARRLAETAPTTEDTPLQILKKLALLRGENLFQQYAASGNQAARLLRLEPWSTETEAWFVPRAEIRDFNQNDDQAVDERDRLIHQPPPDAAAVLAKVQEGIQRQWWPEPSWRSEGDVRRPLKVPLAGWSKSGGMVPLLAGE